MRARRVFRLLLAALFLWLPLSATATPVTYNFTAGQITVTATLLPTLGPPQTILLNGQPSVTVGLTGTSVTFDTAVVPGNALPAFSLVTSPAGPLTLTPALGLISTVSFTALTIVPGTLYSSSVVGTNPYNFNAGPILVSGSITTNLGGPAAFSITTPTATGQVNLSVNNSINTLDLNGISIWSGTIAGLGTLLVKGDVQFNGVPEPGLAVLMAGVAALLAARTRRQ